jgi:hypothetical protein
MPTVLHSVEHHVLALAVELMAIYHPSWESYHEGVLVNITQESTPRSLTASLLPAQDSRRPQQLNCTTIPEVRQSLFALLSSFYMKSRKNVLTLHE